MPLSAGLKGVKTLTLYSPKNDSELFVQPNAAPRNPAWRHLAICRLDIELTHKLFNSTPTAVTHKFS